MLNKTEIESYNTFKDPYQTEKDYLQELLLHEIYSSRYAIGDMVFKGGTALSKFYYSNRFSEDLDFTAVGQGQEPNKLYEDIGQICRSMPYNSSLVRKPLANRFGTISAETAIEGPRYNRKDSTMQRISFEINTISKLKYKPVLMVHRPAYSDAAEYQALVMDKREIVSEKVRALMSRGRRHKERDIYDLYFLLGKGTELDIEGVHEKLKESNIAFSKHALLESITGTEKTWVQLQPFVAQNLLAYKIVKDFLLSEFKKAGLL